MFLLLFKIYKKNLLLLKNYKKVLF
jgi:hypothetical protein